MTKPDPNAPATPKPPEEELAETEAWGEFDKIDREAAGRQAATPAIDGSAVTRAFEHVSEGQDGGAPEGTAADAGGKTPAAEPAPVAAGGAPPNGSAPATPTATKDATAPFAYLPEDMRARVQADWERENAALRGRVAPVQRENARLKRELETRQAQPQPRPKPKDIAMPGDAGWDKFKKDYPEIAGPIETRLSQALGGVRDYTHETVESRVAPVETRVTKGQVETELERGARILGARHPDFTEIADSATPVGKQFDDWLATQRPAVAALIDSADPDDADYLLTQFKASSFYTPPASADPPPANGGNPPAPANGATPKPAQPALDPKRQRQLDGARTPTARGGSPQAAAVTVIPEDPEGAWRAFEKMGL